MATNPQIKTILGFYRKNNTLMPPQEDKCSSCDVIRDGFVPVVKLEEKRSDVNLAVSLADAANMILTEVRECHVRGRWRLALMLVMADHLHFIVQVSGDGAHGVRPLAGNERDNQDIACGRLGCLGFFA